MRGARLQGLVLGALLLAGCTLPPVEPSASEPVAVAVSRDAAPLERFTPPALERVALAARVEPRWVTPDETVHASAETTPSAVDWFAKSRNPLRHDLPAALSERIAPGAAATIAPRAVGRHVFDVEGRPLLMSIVPGAPNVSAIVVVDRDGDGWSVVPQAVRGGPATTILVENRADADALVARRDVETYLATGANASFTLSRLAELGDYDLVAFVADGERVAENATRIVYDDRKPQPTWRFGPFDGTFLLPREDPRRHEIRFALPATGGRVDIEAQSQVGAPFTLQVFVRDASGEVVASGSAPGFDLPPIARGAAALVVDAPDAALVDYRVTLEGGYLMDPPETFFST